LILETAKTLFNQHGTSKVSTNHIAQEAGISPGNLYYHFKDKNHIIRELYEQMINAWEAPYMEIESLDLTFAYLKRFIQADFKLLWDYRFFLPRNSRIDTS
jgi:AcrR family transcriptional regulator